MRQYAAGLSLVLLLAVSVLINTPTAQASTHDKGRESITLSPVSTRFEIQAGTTREEEITIVNDGTVDYDLIVYARPYSVSSENYDPNFTATPSNADAYQWVQFAKTNWRVKAGETVKIPYTIRVPQGAAPGGHYGVVFAETQPKQVEGGTSVTRKKRVGSLIYATVKGDYRTGGQSLGIDISPLQFRPPLSANMIVENTGNADFEVQTTYQVSDVFGNIKHKSQKNQIILPATARKIAFEWAEAPLFGLFNVRVEAKFLDQTSSKESYVLVVPRWLLIVLAVAVVGGGVYAALRARKR